MEGRCLALTEFMREFLGGDGNHHSETFTDRENGDGADRQTIDEAMEEITDQNHPTDRFHSTEILLQTSFVLHFDHGLEIFVDVSVRGNDLEHSHVQR